MVDTTQKRGSVLTVGRDLELARTRAMLLESAGYRTEVACTVPEVALYLQRRLPFGLVIICHSVTESARSEILALLRDQGSDSPVYTLRESVAPTTFLQEVAEHYTEGRFANPLASPG